MAKYYNPDTTFDNIRVGLLDYYGAYHADNNPTGVDVKEYSSTLLIFTCTALSDKVIKLSYASSDLIAYYGSAYEGSGVITGSVTFGGSTTSGTTAAIHMACADNTLLINAICATINSKLFVIGKLTSNAYAVLGLVGSASGSYNAGAYGYLTADQTAFRVFGVEGVFAVGAKRLKMPLALVTAAGALNSGSALTTFSDLYSVSNALGQTVCSKGTGYFMTTSAMYNADGSGIANSMIVETTN